MQRKGLHTLQQQIDLYKIQKQVQMVYMHIFVQLCSLIIQFYYFDLVLVQPSDIIISHFKYQLLKLIQQYIVKDMSEKPILGYWKGRGRAQVARQIFSIAGKQWNEVSYTKGEQWFGKDKQELGLPLPNLPYLIDGEYKLTESFAIYKYIAKKYVKKDLVGKNIQDEARVDSLMASLYDIDHQLVALCWDPQGKQKLEKALKTVVPKIKQIGKVYNGKQFAIGYLTIADLLVAEFSFYFEKMSPEEYKNNEYLEKTRVAVQALPEIKKYYQQQNAVKGPFVEKGDFAF